MEFLALAAKIPVRCETIDYPLKHANHAVADLRAGISPAPPFSFRDFATHAQGVEHAMTPAIKTVLVTGAAKRLGRAIALHLGKVGLVGRCALQCIAG